MRERPRGRDGFLTSSFAISSAAAAASSASAIVLTDGRCLLVDVAVRYGVTYGVIYG